MKDVQLRTALFNGAIGAATTTALIPAVAGKKVRVYAVQISANAACNWSFYDNGTVNKVWTDMYGPATYGRSYDVEAADDRFLFETSNDKGLDVFTVAVATVGGMAVQYAYVPNT